MRIAIPLAVSAAFVAASAVTTAQQQAPPVFRSGTDIVQLDVSVLDKQRKPVHGLTAEHFEIREDGKLQALSVVTEIALPDEYATPPVWAKAAPPDVSSNEVGEKRLFAIVLGRGGVQGTQTTPRILMPPGGTLRRTDPNLIDAMRDIAHGVVDRLGPKDMAAVLGTPCPQVFTDDKEKLYAAIDALLPSPPPCRTTLLGRRELGPIRQQQTLLIRDLAEYLAVVPQRRKAVVYIGPDLPIPRGGMLSQQQWDYMETLWLAQRANVNFYPISPYMIGASGWSGRFDSLKTLADETGGIAVIDPGKYEEGLDQLFIENGSYYMLGYRTTHPEMDGKFRRLSVKVLGRKDVSVRTRTMGFRPKVDPKAEKNASPAALQPSTETAPRLAGLLPDLDVTFDVAAMPMARPGTWAPSLMIVTELTEPVAKGTTRVAQKMDLRILAYSDRGDVLRDVTEHAVLDQAPTTEDGIRYAVHTRLDLNPGWYGLRLVAHNAGTDKVGSNEFDVIVPDFARDVVSISGIALSMPERAPLTTFGRLGGVVPVVPTSLRRFVTSDAVTAFARVYQGGAEELSPVTLTVQLLDASGHAVIDTKEQIPAEHFNGERASDYRLKLPMETLRAGAYLLTIDAAVGARHAPRRDARFIVR